MLGLFRVFMLSAIMVSVLPDVSTAAEPTEDELTLQKKILGLQKDVLVLQVDIEKQKIELREQSALSDVQERIIIKSSIYGRIGAPANLTCSITGYLKSQCIDVANCTPAIADTICGDPDTDNTNANFAVIKYHCSKINEARMVTVKAGYSAYLRCD